MVEGQEQTPCAPHFPTWTHNPAGGRTIHSFCCTDGRLKYRKVTSPTDSDLRSQGQNQVWNTDFLDPDPGSLLLRGLWKAGRTREVFAPGWAPLPSEIYHLSPDCWPKTHTFLRSPYRISCWEPPFFWSVLSWQMRIQWAPFVGSLIKYSHLYCKQFLHLPLGWEDQTQTLSWEREWHSAEQGTGSRSVCVRRCLPEPLFDG